MSTQELHLRSAKRLREDQAELESLLTHHQYPSISLYLPTAQTGKEVRENHIRFKNLLNSAKDRLIAENRYNKQMMDQLELVRPLEANHDFWNNQQDGLAVLITPEEVRLYRTPTTCPELLEVSPRFHLRPLLAVLNQEGSYYLLTLSQNHVCLFKGNADRLEVVEVPDLPTSMDEVFGNVENVGDTQPPHVVSHGSSSEVLFSGQYGTREDRKRDIQQFLRKVAAAVDPLVTHEPLPIVVASVEYYLPMYREVTTQPELLSAHLAGNHDSLDLESLHTDSYQAVVDQLNAQEKAARLKIEEQLSSELVTSELASLVHDATTGRIDTLFVSQASMEYGAYNPDTAEVRYSKHNSPEMYDLLDFAAAQTLLHAGTVYISNLETVPLARKATALRRY